MPTIAHPIKVSLKVACVPVLLLLLFGYKSGPE